MKATEDQKYKMRVKIHLIQLALDEWFSAVNTDEDLDNIRLRVDTLGKYVADAMEENVNLAIECLVDKEK